MPPFDDLRSCLPVVGTASVKAGVVSLSGELIGVESEPSNLISHGQGHMEQDPDEMLSSALRTIKRVLDRTMVTPSRILGMSFDGRMAGIMGIDKNFQPATPYDSWLDTRCAPYVEQMRELSGGIRPLCSERKPLISLSHSAGFEGYQLPANTALLTSEDFMIYLPLRRSRKLVYRFISLQ
jgi:sugar (pentulose or hexulose) kinase